MSILTETTESTVDPLVKYMNSYDVHYICPICTEKYIREDYEEDLVPLGCAYVAAIPYGLAAAQQGFNIDDLHNHLERSERGRAAFGSGQPRSF